MSTTSSSLKRDASEAGLESTHEHGDKKQATNGTTVKQEDDENDADVIVPTQELQRDSHGNIICPYLDTIDRKLLDFDFEKLCSVTLAHMNVYACLVCGKYFQGRGKKSHAYFHALEQDHHVFINLETEQIYCLPDGYQVIDSSLEDIRFNLHPRFTPTETKAIDAQRQFSHALDGTDYLPGTVGLNNIKSTDWLNVTVQALVRVPALRNFWLVDSNWKDKKSPLVKATGELMAKMCNPRSFKSHVSPHELLQAISATSNKRFRIGQQSDPLQFLSWYINTLHKEVGGTKKPGSSIVHQTFQGEIEITTQTPVKKGGSDEKDEKSKKKEDEEMQDEKDVEYTTSTNRTNFLYLSLALPSAPLFKDAQDRTLIPQIPLFDLLKKFDGQTIEYVTGGIKRTYQITKLPRYLIIHAQRFQDNNWFTEKNPTLINFPLRNLDLRPYLKISVPTLEQLQAMNVAKLKEMAIKKNVNVAGALEKSELISKVQQAYSGEDIATRYDLIANIVHEGKPDKGTYKIHILQKATETWYEMQDLHVWTTETMPQLVALSETYIQIYERKQNTTTE